MERTDIKFKTDDTVFNCRAVAIIIFNDKILFQKRKQDKFWALPGGKIRVGETTKEAITRELKEELGLVHFNVSDIAIVSEYFFEFGKDKYHQFIFGHKVLIKDNEWILTKGEFNGIEEQEHLVFKWFELKELGIVSIKPDFFKEQLKSLSSKDIQFTTYKEINRGANDEEK